MKVCKSCDISSKMKKDLCVSTTGLYIGVKKYSSIFVLVHVLVHVRDKKYKIYKSNFNKFSLHG